MKTFSTYPLLIVVLYLGCGPRADVPYVGLTSSNSPAPAASDAYTGMAKRIDRVLDENLNNRLLDAEINAAWQIMHGVICYGSDLTLQTPDRGVVGALDYAFDGGQIMGFELMPGEHPLASTGRPGLKARFEPGSYIGQGHVDQWLAIFAMAELPIDTKIQAGDRSFTLVDWARQAQHDVSNNILDEYSWTLIALTHYFPDEPTWIAAGGAEASWEQLVARELEYELSGSPCGGTHRMAGIARALKAKQRLSLPDSPVWSRAEALVGELLEKTKMYRGRGGKLSSYYFERPGDTADLSAELASAGHLLEFVALAAPREELTSEWVARAADRLCSVLEATRTHDLDCGSLYHALSGLKIYRQRAFDSSPASSPVD